jgi:hypothetical protein
MLAWEQIAEINTSLVFTKQDFKKAFKEWCISIKCSEEKGNSDLFMYGEVIGLQILKLYLPYKEKNLHEALNIIDEIQLVRERLKKMIT